MTDVIIYTEQANISALSFTGCKKFKKVRVNDNNSKYSVIDGVLYSKDRKTIYLYPPGKETEFEISSEVEIIRTYAFKANLYLSKIDIPNSVKTIEFGAFESCNNMENVVINSKKIDRYAFNGNKNIKKIEIGNNVEVLKEEIFNGCNNVQEVNYLGSISDWNNISKVSNWNNNSSITKVICTDGVVNL